MDLHEDANSVLVDVFHSFLGIHHIVALLVSISFPMREATHLGSNGNKSTFNLEVPRKLLQSHLSLCSHDDVGSRIMDILSSGFHLCLPFPLES